MVERISPLGEEKAKEQDHGEALLHYVVDTLTPHLEPAQQESLRGVLPRAVETVRELGIKPEAAVIGDVSSFERGVLLMGIVSSWGDEAAFGNRRFEIQIAHVVLPHERERKLPDESAKDYNQVPVNVIANLVEMVWPESRDYADGALAWAREHHAIDGIVTLPYQGEQKRTIYTEAMMRAGVPKDRMNRIGFSGIASHDDNVGFVWEGESERIAEHERAHLRNAGLMVGSIGTGLDEAITDMKARRVVYDDEESPEAVADPPYDYHFMLDVLFENVPGLQEVIERRYEEDTMETSTQLMTKLINTFGLSGLAALYLIHPDNSTSDTYLHDPVGYYSPIAIIDMFYPESSSFATFDDLEAAVFEQELDDAFSGREGEPIRIRIGNWYEEEDELTASGFDD